MAHTPLFTQGLAELKAGRFAEARKLFSENEEKAGTTAATKDLLRQAEQNLLAGKVDVAAQQFNTVLERNPTLPEVYLGLARIALFTGQLADARTHAMAAVKVGPQLGLSWTLLGLVHEAEGDPKAALTHLEKGAQLGAHVFLCQFNFGRLLASEGRAGEGIPFLLKAVELEPKNADGFMILGMAQKKVKQFEKALKAIEKAKDLNPKNVDGWATLADVLFEAREFAAARTTLDNGLKAVGEHPALLEKATACAMMLDDAAGACAYLERELKVVPQHEQGWLNLAHLSLLTENLDRSESAAKELIKRNPKSWEAWFHLGNLYDAVPDEAKSEDAYRKALAIKGDEWKVLMNLATMLVQTTVKAKHQDAKLLLLKAKGLAPAGEWRVHYNLALAHVRLNEIQEALALAREIQSKAPATDPMVAEAKKLESNLLEKN
ncbi:MAG: tetratricopeptide repeat protein [Archangium sp.]|nr:tetratricopeptide repeat protein [Archangium sp.]MDP3153783.1 tetratricopeptide repeat protein [Archangium sp.]MDP3575658.1 tetratricopeptide repeat protein [Archangium sp.]